MSAAPLMRRPSNPAHLSLAAVQPPMWLSVTVPVRGLLVTTASLPDILARVPERGPFMMQRRFSGPRGSTWGPFSNTYFTPRPLPPTYISRSLGSGAKYSTWPVLRSIRAILWAYPPSILHLLR